MGNKSQPNGEDNVVRFDPSRRRPGSRAAGQKNGAFGQPKTDLASRIWRVIQIGLFLLILAYVMQLCGKGA